MTALDGQPLSEADLVEACNQVYKDGYTSEQWQDFKQGFNHSKINRFFDELIAGDWRDWIEDVVENNNMKLDVICKNLMPQFNKFREEGDYVRANQLFVSVYWYEVKKAMYMDKKTGVRVATNLKYPLVEGSTYSSNTGYKRRDENADDQFI
ncbi:MAG: hypothetical protein IPN74_02595 [Haliscomenobacter sp.]|nr:hypothetical protein [Haliscomenobacter sp.]